MSGPQEPHSLLAAPATHQDLATRMSFLDHLGELRRRLIYALLALLLAAMGCFYYIEDIFEFMRLPLAALPAQKMLVLSPMEMFITYIKLALLSGLFVAAPFILLQMWLFVAPGLYPHERRWVLPFVLLGSLFFIGGAAFCFFGVLPVSFRYLVDMVPFAVEAHYSVSAYFSLVMQLLLAFGVIFELPLAMALLGAVGVVPAHVFVRFRKYWIVVSVVLGGVLTPTPDPMTQMMMAVPLMLFYELGIVAARILGNRRRVASMIE